MRIIANSHRSESSCAGKDKDREIRASILRFLQFRTQPRSATSRLWRALFAILTLVSAATVPAAAPVTALAFTPDGAALVSASARNLDVRSPNQGGVERRIPCGLSKVMS